jgi:hypothetical protein
MKTVKKVIRDYTKSTALVKREKLNNPIEEARDKELLNVIGPRPLLLV